MTSKSLLTASIQEPELFCPNEAPRTSYVPDDADGNMTSKISKQSHDTTTFIWDIENKLTEVRNPGTIAKYTYDALGRRMSKTVNGETKQFRYDGQDLIIEMNGQDSILADFTHGPGIDNPLMMNRAGKNYYYAKDGLGSVTALTDSTGNVVHEYKYSVFGKMVADSGDSVDNTFTYTSRELDRETGLMFYRARYYDPQLGRFLSEDPLGNFGENNLFRFVSNNPINGTDPLGLLVIPQGGMGNGWGYFEYLNTVNRASPSPEARQRLEVLESSQLQYPLVPTPTVNVMQFDEKGNVSEYAEGGHAEWNKTGASIYYDPSNPKSLLHELAGHGYQREIAEKYGVPYTRLNDAYNYDPNAKFRLERDAFDIAGQRISDAELRRLYGIEQPCQ